MEKGTKVLIKEGLHQLVVGSIGTITGKGNGNIYFDVTGEDSNHFGRTIENLLSVEEFEPVEGGEDYFGHCDSCGKPCDGSGICSCGGPIAITK